MATEINMDIIDEAVSKSLKNKEVPPKRKHERNIILFSWGERGANAIFADIFKRPLNVREISCYKCLVVIHKLLREGHPKALVDAHNRRHFFTSLINYYKGSHLVYGKLSADYCAYVLAKIDFHHAHKEIEGTMMLEKFLESKPNLDANAILTLATHLLDLQQSAIDFQNILLKEKELSDCKVSPMIPMIIESYNVYQTFVYLMKQLVSAGKTNDVFQFLSQRFVAQYSELKKWYVTSSNIRYVTSIIAVPVLSPDPPKFLAEASTSKSKSKSPRKPEPAPVENDQVIEVEVPDFNVRGPNMQNDLFNLFAPSQQNVPPPAPIANQPSPFFNEWFAAQSQPVVPVPAPAPVVTAPPEPQIIIKKEVPEDVLRRLAELEKRIRELEGYNQQLTLEKNALSNENAALKRRLAEQETKLSQADSMRKAVLEEQIALSKAAMLASLLKFDDPNQLGNQGADCNGLMEAIERLRRMFGLLVDSAKDNNGKTTQNSRDVSDATVSLLNDAKGIAQLMEDLGLKNELMNSSKNAADAIARFLDMVSKIAGSLPNDQQLGLINSGDANVRALLARLLESVDKTMIAQRAAALSRQPNLEDVAERELLAAAKMIEDAAKQLEAHKAKANIPANPSGELNVEQAIFAAAMAITAATQGLVKAATDAQHERVTKGVASDPNAAKYHNDPMWVEGLISAARAVAEATRQLVAVANDAFQGRIDDAALIAASKAVASSTTQLVTATRSKSADPFSKTQTNLDNAAAAVTRATQALVRAAKRNEEADYAAATQQRNENIAAGIKAEMEQQAKIIRLEKDLEMARRILHGMNRSKYADAGQSLVSPRGGPINDHSPRGDDSQPVPSSSSSMGQGGNRVDTFNASVKDLQAKVGASLNLRVPQLEPTPFDQPPPPVPSSTSSTSNAASSNPFLM